MANPSLPEICDLKAILDHVRGQFQYHATQRLNTIRYFFVAYAVFAAAYVNVATGNLTNAPHYVQLVLSLSAAIITVGFWILDSRNAQLVHINEEGLKEIEELVAKKFDYQRFRMTDASEKPDQKIRKYQFIANVLYGYISVVSIAAALRDAFRLFGVCG